LRKTCLCSEVCKFQEKETGRCDGLATPVPVPVPLWCVSTVVVCEMSNTTGNTGLFSEGTLMFGVLSCKWHK
jgi:hypothetical protein